MPETATTSSARANETAGHLRVHLEGAHPVEIPFLFEQPQKHLGPAFAVSLAYHLVMFALLLVAIKHTRRPGTTAPELPDHPPRDIIWLSDPGPGGGGGGGGNRMKEPPRQAKLPGTDTLTVPVAKPPRPENPANAEPNPIEPLNIPAKSLAAAAAESLVGAIEVPPGPPTPSQGPGSNGGAGSTGPGGGIGPGTGPGLGPGTDGGVGGRTYRPGSGVTLPRVLVQVKPQYTSDAMRAKIQGTVLLQCIVRPDGAVGDVQVVRSLDPMLGLDREAIKAAKTWRFAPGTRLGEPVPVLVTIELTFTLR